MKVVEVWGTDSGAQSLPTRWGPLAFCYILPCSLLFVSSLTCCLKPLSSDQCPWPFVLAPVSFCTNASFSSSLLCFYRSLSDSFFLFLFILFSCILCPLISSHTNVHSRQATATFCWFIESKQGMQIPSMFLMPFRPCWHYCVWLQGRVWSSQPDARTCPPSSFLATSLANCKCLFKVLK